MKDIFYLEPIFNSEILKFETDETSLENLYDFRCQICGKNIGEIYGAKVVECHHIMARFS